MSHRSLAALCAAAAVLALPAVATASQSFNSSLSSGSVNLGGYHIVNDDHAVLGFGLDVTPKATWTGSLPTTVGWNSDNVHPYSQMTVSRMALPSLSGKLHVTWNVDGWVVGGLVSSDLNKNVSTDVTCLAALVGAAYDCSATSPQINLLESPGIPNSPYANLVLKASFSVTPKGAITTRKVWAQGGLSPTAVPLSLTLAPQPDTFTVPYGLKGSQVVYSLDPVELKPSVGVSQKAIVSEGAMDPVFGLSELPAVSNWQAGPTIHTTPAFDLKGTGPKVVLGYV